MRSAATIFLFSGLLASAGLTGAFPGALTHAVAQDKTPEVEAVDALAKLFGVHPGKRLNHAKGIMAEGTFVATPEAGSLCKAAFLSGAPVKATVRLSDPTGVPEIPDGAYPDASPKGFAVKMTAPDGSESDMVMISTPLFPSATVAEFRDFLLALADSPPTAAHPTKIETYLGAHPSALAFVQGLPQAPESFATESFYGVNAYKLIARDGHATMVRFRFVPVAGEKHLTKEEVAQKGPNFLMDEIKARLTASPVRYRLVAQIAEPGDQTNNATIRWPETRKLVTLGELMLTKPVANSEEAEKAIIFLPGLVADGIETSDDPLIPSRDGAYADSYSRRNP